MPKNTSNTAHHRGGEWKGKVIFRDQGFSDCTPFLLNRVPGITSIGTGLRAYHLELSAQESDE